MKIKHLNISSFPPGKNKGYSKSDTFFDCYGNKTEYIEYKAGKIEVWEKLVYDSKNRLIEKITYSGNSYNPKDYKPTSTKYEYDQNGYLITGENQLVENGENGFKIITSFYLNGTIKDKRYFNQNNICIEENSFGKGQLTRRILYDENGRVLENRSFRSDGFALKYTLNTYNNIGQLVRIKSVSKRRNQISDEDGKRVGDEYVSEDRLLKYNDAGLLIEDVDFPVDPNNAFADVLNSYDGYSHKYFYNLNKLIEKENLYLCGELVMTYGYSYQFWE